MLVELGTPSSACAALTRCDIAGTFAARAESVRWVCALTLLDGRLATATAAIARKQMLDLRM
jgi:hypothetical protein